MVVDDDETIRTVLSAVCTSLSGVSLVGVAEDGEDAVAKFDRLRPDVVLLDIHMPKLSGMHALAKIKELEPKACIAMLTAESDAKVVRACLRAGAVSYVLKTNPPDKIRATIRDVCFARLKEIACV